MSPIIRKGAHAVPRRLKLSAIPIVAAITIAAIVISSAQGNKSASAAAQGLTGLYATNAVPVQASENDGDAVEVGVRFTVAQAGAVLGIRYYKSEENRGTHVGNLWSSTGKKLATATFTSESVTGWQTVKFATPIAVSPGQAYVASYHTNVGHYAQAQYAFKNGAKVGNSLITSTAGVYVYGPGGFPTSTWHDASYYVDVLFQPGAAGSAGGVATTPTSKPATSSTKPSSSAPSHSTSAKPQSSAPATKPSTPSSPSKTASSPTLSAPTGTKTSTPPPVTSSSSSSSTPPPSTTPTTGFPDDSNTGWAHTGVTLTPYTGPDTITKDGTVIDGKDVTTCLSIVANNVTIRNSRIQCASSGPTVAGTMLLMFGNSRTNSNGLTITDTEFTRPGGSNGGADYALFLYGTNVTLTRVNIHNVTSGVHFSGTNVTIQDSYIHSMVNISGQDHNDAVIANGGASGVTLEHNTLEVPTPQTTPIAMYPEGSPNTNWVIDSNLIAGGGYCIYPSYTKGEEAPNNHITVTNNVFSKMYFSGCGSFGPVNIGPNGAKFADGASNVWTGNVWSTGGTVSPN